MPVWVIFTTNRPKYSLIDIITKIHLNANTHVGLIQTSHDLVPPPSTKSQMPPCQSGVPEKIQDVKFNNNITTVHTISLLTGALPALSAQSLCSLRKAWHKSALLHRQRQWILLNILFSVVKHNVQSWQLTNAFYFLPDDKCKLLNRYTKVVRKVKNVLPYKDIYW